MWNLLLPLALCFSFMGVSSALDPGYRAGNCSMNMVNCDDMARCQETHDHDNPQYTCKCIGDGVTGDGFKDGTGCHLPSKPCNSDTDCPQYGKCNTALSHCECNKGFTGDGYTCEDVDECKENPCDSKAKCDNIPGSFKCTCEKGYVGDGITCRFFCYNHNDCDWPRARCNTKNQCECIDGYRGNGATCTDVDECAEGTATDCNSEASCENTDGGYKCTCNNGFAGNGKTCNALQRSCESISNLKNKRYYMIDPDFKGPAKAFWVQCIRKGAQWVTSVLPKGVYPMAAPQSDQPLTIEYGADTDDIKALIDRMPFCSQKFTFSCTPGYSLFPGTTWTDINGKTHNSWGSSMDGKCVCGELKQCKNACHCDGTQTEKNTVDEARIVDKTQLPLTSIHFAQGQAHKGRVDVDPMQCSNNPIDVPKDCDEAKFVNDVTENTPMYIDVDGPGGQDPFLVFCDMESYEHVGITQIPTNRKNPVEVTSSDGQTIEYTVDQAKMKALIDGSLFCMQRVEFRCKNSKLLGSNGGHVFVGSDMKKLDYFPGAQGQTGSCPCGTTESCTERRKKCNCNSDDGQEHKDFGRLTDKSTLPVTKVTAQTGNSRSAVYDIGELRCSQKQFGIEPTCEKYHALGVRDSYTYLIDPDGTGPQTPFSVQCQFVEDPSQGKTIVHHNLEGTQTVSGSLNPSYLMANPGQIEALRKRSTFCTQDISVDCSLATADLSTVSWTGGSDAPPVTSRLTTYLDSCGPNHDTCKCSQNGKDTGTVTDKNLLPISKMDFSSTGKSLPVDIGPLVCSETFPTCKQLADFANSDRALEGEAAVTNGFYTVDPDGPGGAAPFTVNCSFPQTQIDTSTQGMVQPNRDDPLETVSQCFDITYKSPTGKVLTPAQVAAYAAASKGCQQSMSVKCKKAPVSKMVNFTTCDGKTQVGWAGSYGQDSCACGVNGICDGGTEALCNCDRATSKLKEDAGTITQADRLPVCRICMSIDPPKNGNTWSNPLPELSFEVGALICDKKNGGGHGSCQAARRKTRMRDEVSEVPTIIVGNGNRQIPVGCRMYSEPAIGVLTVKPKDPVHPPEKDKKVDINFQYVTLNLSLVGEAMSEQKYCSQKVFLYCTTGDWDSLSGASAWYDRSGKAEHEWTRLHDSDEIDKDCEEHQDLCDQCGNPIGYLVKGKDLLPVTRLALDGKNIGVVLDEVECFDIMKSCQDIYDKNERQTGFLGKNRYLIDPDQAGPLRPFRVDCEFDKTTDNAVTLVDIDRDWQSDQTIEGHGDDTGDSKVEYENASPEQINKLAEISGFCWQNVNFECQNFHLLENPKSPSTYYKLYNDKPSTSFGTGKATDFEGCACHKLGFCYTALECNCDADGTSMDQGAITDRASIPVRGVHIAEQSNPKAEATFNIGSVRCSAKSTALPRDCADAFEIGDKDGVGYHRTGDYLISPNPGVVEPYMVHCDFNTFPGKGVTVIRPNLNKETPLPTDSSDTPTEVPYKGVENDQIKELVERSAYCYQGVRFDCYDTALMSGGSYFQSTDKTKKWNFWGGGKPGENGGAGTCACGEEDACSGLDSSEGQRTRPCNCDLVDTENRRDAGVIDDKDALPVTMFRLGKVSDISQANLTVGDLYCSQEPLNLNECELDLNDCDPRAECQDMEEGYHCVCPEGWQGKGVVTDSSMALANGRVCIDDNECVTLNPCSYTTECHNLPGSYECKCKKGYRPTSKTECEDIDECAEGTDDCGENAFCDNLIGSYRCICNKGFRGDGKECVPVGTCSCFGDPHCNSFDKRWLHFMGDCHYTMASDGCNGKDPTYAVEVEEWRKGQPKSEQPYSWVKSVTVKVDNKTILMGQGPSLVVNGQVVNSYIDSFRLRVVLANNRVQLRAFSGLEVTWDGNDRVVVTVPQGSRGNTCGLCGNYDGDPDNDWTVGPGCPARQGQVSDNYRLVGNSWAVESQCTPDCDETPPGPPHDECTHENGTLVEQECRKLLDAKISVFKKCLGAKQDSYLGELQFSCVFDICASNEKLNAKICRMAENIAADCADVEKIPVNNWRDKVDACPEYTCPKDQHYMPCGPSNPLTCLNVDDPPSDGNGACAEGCFCGDGLLLEGDKCIKKEECGCHHEDTYIPVGGKLVLKDCSAEIKCDVPNSPTSQPVECGDNAECKVEDGAAKCHCNEGFEEKDGKCEESGPKCPAGQVHKTCGPAHPPTCSTVDDGPSDAPCVPGCFCRDGDLLEDGKCITKEQCGCYQDGKYMTIGETKILNDCSAEIKCEGLNKTNSQPVECDANKQCRYTGGTAMCRCNDGFKEQEDGTCKEYDCPEGMKYKSCGPANPLNCFNADGAAVSDSEPCEEGCFCPEGLFVQNNKCIKKEECGCLHEDTYIPLGGKLILDDCSAEIKCDVFNSTTSQPVECGDNAECKVKDVAAACHCKDGFVEKDGKCEPACPEGQEHKTCGPAHPPTCSTVDDSPSDAPCVPGCFCPDGDLMEDGKCITKEQCGCYQDGKYMTAGEKLILSDCSAKITCEGLNVTKPEPEVCGANEECKKEGGVASCHCKEGFVKADDDSCQEPSCPEGQEHKTCGPAHPPTCSTAGDAPSDAPCVPGCFCPDGWVMESGKCIEKKQCGCYEEGKYIAAGEELILSDCSAKITCEGLNVTKADPEVCGANEECKKEDGVASCHCKEGFVETVDGSCQEPKCPDGKHHKTCGPANPPTCSTADDAPTDAPCVEGCFCPDGWVLENNKCIKKQQCGCYTQGSYIQAGQKLILSDCSAQITCKGLNVTTSEPVPCGVNEECKRQDNTAACHCKEGYVEIDGTCKEPNCPAGQHFTTCGPVDPLDCTTVNSVPSNDDGTCVARCVCPDGLLMEGNKCVTTEQCGCYHQDSYIAVLAKYTKSDCSAEVTCQGLNKTVSKPLPACGENEECTSVKGVYSCRCKEGYAVINGKCQEYSCPEGKHHSTCGPANPRTCFNVDDAPSDEQEPCVEGCFCPDGLLAGGNKCLKREQCGCYHENRYIPIGAKLILNDCSAKMNCEGLNETTLEPIACAVNEECRREDGVSACRCKEGYVKVNGTCVAGTCANIRCGENMECQAGVCDCKPGYHDQCGQCVDIDECKTRSHMCTGLGEKCVNNLGSYTCQCMPGFTRDGDQCKDVDECKTEQHECVDNSECVNTIGNYSCECCAGYKHDQNAKCVLDMSLLIIATCGRKCCACQGPMCYTIGEVCGTDGTTYPSYKTLYDYACLMRNSNLEFNYMGKCQDSCDDVVCGRSYQCCHEDSKGVPQCACPECGDHSNKEPVCGSDGKTYTGACSLKKAACRDVNMAMVRLDHRGSC